MDKVLSLYDICLKEVSGNLMAVERIPTSALDNPFRIFPSEVVQDLITLISKETTNEYEYLKSSYLHFLLTSGRVKSLNLPDINLLEEDGEEMFNYLQPNSDKLRSIKIYHQPRKQSYLLSSSFGTLLRSAKNLVSLETSLTFKLSELSHCENLEKLVLNFEVTDLTSFLHVGGEIRYNHSLKMLRIIRFEENHGLYFDIAGILQYCVELIEIDYNIAPSLTYLHEIQKATRYKLQKTRLGESEKKKRIRSKIVEIASLYCPELRELTATTSGYSAVKSLSNFSHITKLNLVDPKYPDAYYYKGLGPLLKNSCFSHNLKSLVLVFIYELDFPQIGAFCPNLEELVLEGCSEYTLLKFDTNSFKKLISLSIKYMYEPLEESSFIGILSTATYLEFLSIDDARNFTDTTLNDILENTEAFSRLKTLRINVCGLSFLGLNKLIQSLVSIEFIEYGSPNVSVEITEYIFKSMGIKRYTIEEE